MTQRYFAVAPKGLENVAAQELKDLGATEVQTTMGGVHFSGTIETLYKSNLWVRSISRVLVPIREFAASSPEMLYDQMRRIKWQEYLTLQMTFAVDCTLANSHMTHSHFVALKAKDAIADQLRTKYGGERSNVDTVDPDIKINLFINNNRCVVSLDSSGESLHRRGYRQGTGPAPLKENLAAALLLTAGYDGSVALMDPMCGSGTFLVEGAMIALDMAPGLLRKRFSFFNWPDFDQKLWDSLVKAAQGRVKEITAHPILGFDRDRKAVEIASKNIEAAGLSRFVTVKRQELEEFRPIEGETGIIVTNPPYGERMGAGIQGEEDLAKLYSDLGSLMKHQFKGWTGYILTGNLDVAKKVGLHTARRFEVYNGPIESRFLKYELYEGSKKKSKQPSSVPN